MKFGVLYLQTADNAQSPIRVVEQTTGRSVAWINRYLDREYVRRLANTTLRSYAQPEICAEPRLTNANLVLRYRCVAVPPSERERLRRVFSSTPELHLRTLAETFNAPVQTVLRLVLDGTLHINWWEPLGLDSKVSIVPVGPQIWPVPPPTVSPTSFPEAICCLMG